MIICILLLQSIYCPFLHRFLSNYRAAAISAESDAKAGLLIALASKLKGGAVGKDVDQSPDEGLLANLNEPVHHNADQLASIHDWNSFAALLPLKDTVRLATVAKFEEQGVTVHSLSRYESVKAMYEFLTKALSVAPGIAIQCVRLVKSMRDGGHLFLDLFSAEF